MAPTLDAHHNRKWGSNQWVNNGFAVCVSSGQANAEVRADGGAPSLMCLHEEPIVAHSLRAEGFDASEGGTGRETPLVPVAFNWNAQAAQLPSIDRDTSICDGLTCSQQAGVALATQVRRLTPVECSRLQGFPDDYLTQVPWRGKVPPPDGPMYKALGNSMAVPVMAWIGKRIQMVEDIIAEKAA